MSVQRFIREKSGNIAMAFALAMASILAILGLAVDFQRGVSAETGIQNALDASALAAARSLQNANTSEADAKALAETMFAADIKASNNNLICPRPTIVIDRDNGTVSADVTCALPTTLAGLFGMEKMEINQASTSSIQISNLDLALMLDVSGSMSGQKLTDLKTAAKDAVDTLITPYTGDRVRISYNTYSTAINVGAYAEAVKGPSFDKSSPLRLCVTERDGIAKFDDAAPGFGKYMNEEAKSTDNKAMSCPSTSIAPLTSDASSLKAGIDKLSANGWTAGHLGVAWAWYLISPEWDNIWPTASKPHAYDEDGTIKAVILMTDGEFNTFYETGQGDSDQQAKKLCKAMKDEGVIVYSVAFQAPKAGKKVLKACATSDEYFFDASNGEELKQAYAEIASQLMNLRLTK